MHKWARYACSEHVELWCDTTIRFKRGGSRACRRTILPHASKCKSSMNNEHQSINTPSEIVLYQPNENISLEVKLDATHETVWLTQQQIADLFGTKQPAISKHLSNIYKSGELDENSTYSILEYMGNDGPRSG